MAAERYPFIFPRCGQGRAGLGSNLSFDNNTMISYGVLGVLRFLPVQPGPWRIPYLAGSGAPVYFPPVRPGRPGPGRGRKGLPIYFSPLEKYNFQ